MDQDDDDLPPVLVDTGAEPEREAENGPKVPLTIVTGACCPGMCWVVV